MTAKGLLNLIGRPCVAYDPSSGIFAIALNIDGGWISLYDIKNYDKEPFETISLRDPMLSRDRQRSPVYTSVKFSNDGKWILVGTAGDVHYVVDSFKNTIVARLVCTSTFPFASPSFSSLPSLHSCI